MTHTKSRDSVRRFIEAQEHGDVSGNHTWLRSRVEVMSEVVLGSWQSPRCGIGTQNAFDLIGTPSCSKRERLGSGRTHRTISMFSSDMRRAHQVLELLLMSAMQ